MPKIVSAALSALSLSVSSCFLWSGWLVLSDSETDLQLALFGSIVGLYGAVSGLLLCAAWLKPQKYLTSAMTWTTAAALASVVLGSLDVGMISGLEWGLISVLGAVLLCQWCWLYRIVERAMARKPGPTG